MDVNLAQIIEPCVAIAKNAGARILEIYQGSDALNIQIKADSTPVTYADIAAHNVIVEGLTALTPQIPILSEEGANIPVEVRRQWQTYWLIDPLDGTKEFIHRTDEFTVNIALIHQGHSLLGVIYAPVLDSCYYAYANAGAYKQIGNAKAEKIHTVKARNNQLRITVSRRHSLEVAESFIQNIPSHTKYPKGSSLKTCFIAEGSADVYPCFGKTSEWDMGAAQCIIEEAGGAMLDLDFQPIKFNQKESLLNPPLLVIGDTDYNWKQYL